MLAFKTQLFKELNVNKIKYGLFKRTMFKYDTSKQIY